MKIMTTTNYGNNFGRIYMVEINRDRPTLTPVRPLISPSEPQWGLLHGMIIRLNNLLDRYYKPLGMKYQKVEPDTIENTNTSFWVVINHPFYDKSGDGYEIFEANYGTPEEEWQNCKHSIENLLDAWLIDDFRKEWRSMCPCCQKFKHDYPIGKTEIGDGWEVLL